MTNIKRVLDGTPESFARGFHTLVCEQGVNIVVRRTSSSYVAQAVGDPKQRFSCYTHRTVDAAVDTLVSNMLQQPANRAINSSWLEKFLKIRAGHLVSKPYLLIGPANDIKYSSKSALIELGDSLQMLKPSAESGKFEVPDLDNRTPILVGYTNDLPNAYRALLSTDLSKRVLAAASSSERRVMIDFDFKAA